MGLPPKDTVRSDRETARVRDRAVRRALNTPPTHHTTSRSDKPKPGTKKTTERLKPR